MALCQASLLLMPGPWVLAPCRLCRLWFRVSHQLTRFGRRAFVRRGIVPGTMTAFGGRTCPSCCPRRTPFRLGRCTTRGVGVTSGCSGGLTASCSGFVTAGFCGRFLIVICGRLTGGTALGAGPLTAFLCFFLRGLFFLLQCLRRTLQPSKSKASENT